MSAKKNNVEQKKGMPTAAKWAIGVFAFLVAAALIVVSIVFTPANLAKSTVALRLNSGAHELTAADLNYHFREKYFEMAQAFGNDTTLLSSMTDQIKSAAVEAARSSYAIYDAAKAEGYELTADEVKEIDDEINSMDSTAVMYGLKDGNQFLAAMYGAGCDKENYRTYRQVNTLVNRYMEDFKAKTAGEITDQKVDEYYAEHKADFDTVTYRQFTVMVEDGAADPEAALAAAKENAEKMAQAAKEDPIKMDEMAKELAPEENKQFYEGEDATLVKDAKIADVEEEVRDWLTDPARVKGDVTVIEGADKLSFKVVCFISYNDNDYDTINVRHILVKADSEDDESMKTANETAHGYLKEFEDGDKTEESFAELAKKYTEDSNGEQGGLYENVPRGQMVETFDEWCYEEGRKPGDTAVIQTDYGFHVMYFVGKGENYRAHLVREKLTSDAYDAWAKEITSMYTADEVKAGMDRIATTTAYG